jgi:hypothetical protein
MPRSARHRSSSYTQATAYGPPSTYCLVLVYLQVVISSDHPIPKQRPLVAESLDSQIDALFALSRCVGRVLEEDVTSWSGFKHYTGGPVVLQCSTGAQSIYRTPIYRGILLRHYMRY